MTNQRVQVLPRKAKQMNLNLSLDWLWLEKRDKVMILRVILYVYHLSYLNLITFISIKCIAHAKMSKILQRFFKTKKFQKNHHYWDKVANFWEVLATMREYRKKFTWEPNQHLNLWDKTWVSKNNKTKRTIVNRHWEWIKTLFNNRQIIINSIFSKLLRQLIQTVCSN
jgi:hypothetical protein